MRPTFRSVAWWAVCLAGVVPTARGQQLLPRRGFWISFGPGYGSATYSCTGCATTGGRGAPTGFLRMGGTPSPQVLLGGEVDWWAKSQGGGTATMGNVVFTASYYPKPLGGFFLRAGAGYSNFTQTGNGPSATGNGFAVLAGVGYDILVGRTISLTPIGTLSYGYVGDITQNNVITASAWRQVVVDVGLGLTIHKPRR